VMNCFTRT